MIRLNLPDPEMYALILKMVGDERANQESLTVIRTRPNQRTTNESVSEYIYPTEWDPAEVPSTVGVQILPRTSDGNEDTNAVPDAGKLEEAPKPEELPEIMTPATATSFETRNAGFTLEAEPVVEPDGRTIDMRIAPEFVTNVGRRSWGQGVSTLETTEFESQRLSTSLRNTVGEPRLVGTMNRPPVSEVDENSAERIWFAFLTVSAVK